jgi:hypothetical protein
MHLLKACCLAGMLLVIFTACKKDKDDQSSIPGLWKGKYGNTTDYPNKGYAVLFRTNGTIRVYDGSDTATAYAAEGTYSISNSTVTTTYDYGDGMEYSTTAEMNVHKTFMEGTYGNGDNTWDAGRFFLVKQ